MALSTRACRSEHRFKPVNQPCFANMYEQASHALLNDILTRLKPELAAQFIRKLIGPDAAPIRMAIGFVA